MTTDTACCDSCLVTVAAAAVAAVVTMQWLRARQLSVRTHVLLRAVVAGIKSWSAGGVRDVER